MDPVLPTESRDDNADTAPEPSLDEDSDTESEQTFGALDEHSTREQIDALGKQGVANTRSGDKRMFYGWLATIDAAHWIDRNVGKPGYYETGDYIDHAMALGMSRPTAYKVRHLHKHLADFVEWGERVARDRLDKKATKLYPSLSEMINRHPPPPRNSRRAQPEKLTAAEKLAQAEDEADKLAKERDALQRTVQQHAEAMAWLRAEYDAEIARLRAELAKRPPHEAPADLTPDGQLALNLDETPSVPQDDPEYDSRTPPEPDPAAPKSATTSRRPGRPKMAPGSKKRTRTQIDSDARRANALRIARDLPGSWSEVAKRVQGDVKNAGWVQMISVSRMDGINPIPLLVAVPEITEAGLEQLAQYEAAD